MQKIIPNVGFTYTSEYVGRTCAYHGRRWDENDWFHPDSRTRKIDCFWCKKQISPGLVRDMACQPRNTHKYPCFSPIDRAANAGNNP